MDVVRAIRRFNAGRDPQRLQLKYRAMRASPFAFLRGSCHLFYERLPRDGLPASAPPVWACGDLHLENFGCYKGDNRLVHFDLNDFDEAVLAPASWDLVRLLASLWIASEHAAALGNTFLDAYASALAQGKAGWLERETARGLVRKLLDEVRERTRPAFLDTRTTRTGRTRRLRVDGTKALPAPEDERQRIVDFMRGFADRQEDRRFHEVLDVARRVAGTGSLGLERWIVLVRGRGSPDGNFLLDLKQARPSSLLPRLDLAQPAWPGEAHRVVELQRRVQAVAMAFLQPVSVGGLDCVLRGLQPSEDRISWARAQRSPRRLEGLVQDLGRLVAWGQLRSAGRQGSATADELIDFAGRRKWRQRLLDLSHECATRVRADAAVFNRAWDDGAFRG